ncbi:Tfp pilus assembly protein PilF [Stigmatella erecta]|uniref:Tfp pilus assembly protein PilF n=1 Tax=Stigmatella erecta TaxID=83460 RepID=A0A1I0KHR6_9BACT|nr:Tfp pilus assembly protein PilF [Stigmatella erecta]
MLITEAEPGAARQAALDRWLQTFSPQETQSWHVPADFDEGGSWAGLQDLLSSLLPQLRSTAPGLMRKHAYELCNVLPSLRRELDVQSFALTDNAMGEEKVRHYAPDRAFRIVHGLIDLLAAWHPHAPASRWVLALDGFDRASNIVRYFAQQLVRRRGAALHLTLVLSVSPGRGEEAAAQFQPLGVSLSRVRLELPPGTGATLSAGEAAQRAEEIEQRTGLSVSELEPHLPSLVSLWRKAGREDKLARARAWAMSLAIHRGLYDDAMRHGAALADKLELLRQQSHKLYWGTVFNLIYGHMAQREPEQALALALKVEPLVDLPEMRIRLFYNLAMLHARFLPRSDLAKAEEYLDAAVKELDQADLPEDQKHFVYVFNRNGLALVRLKQGRLQDAISLCQLGFKRLTEELAADRHKLHRSVLLYNIAQVYSGLGEHEAALSHYTAAIQLDPNYSEYYNERGAILMKQGQFDAAVKDLQKALQLSPPYPEVRINLGQCYRLEGKLAEAVEEYTCALDLDPNNAAALRGRGGAYDDLGQAGPAMADYNLALKLDPAQPIVLASRAILHYSAGKLHESLEDLDLAVSLAPKMPDLYRNRAVALFELGRPQEAVRDLQLYLQCEPQAEDRPEIEARIRAAQAAPRA